MKVENNEAVEIFRSAGASVGTVKDYAIVKIPPKVVEECIENAPKKVVYYGRDPEKDYVAESGSTTFSTFGECINIFDLDSRECRKTVKKDCEDIALICDYLDEVKVYDRAVNPSDKPTATQALHNAEASFTNIAKHITIGPGSAGILRKMMEMAAACVGGMEAFKKRPIFSSTVCPASPLLLVDDVCDVIIESARQGIGLILYPMPLSGVSAAATLAGTMVSINAEVLSALVLAQLTAKGIPCTYASSSTIFDLKRVVVSLGAPEMALLSMGTTRLAQYYSLPCIASGGMSDSKLSDAQTGYEAGYSALMCALARPNILAGLGTLEQGLTFDYAKLLMDYEMTHVIKKMAGGIGLTDEELALDVIHEIGPGGEFLSHEHTFDHMREQSSPKLFSREIRENWLARGGMDLTEKAYREAKNILGAHKPKPLPAGAAEEMRKILRDYEVELGLV